MDRFDQSQQVVPSSKVNTLCPRAGQGEHHGDALIPAIVQSTTFCQDGSDQEPEHAYSRVSNPTVAALEKTLGQLENAPPAVAFTTGLAAETALFLSVLKSGDHVVCSQAVYGGTTRLLQQVLPELGVSATFADARSASKVSAAVRGNTRLVFIETPANPTLDVCDIEAVSAVAQKAGALLAVDNTFLTAVLQEPLACGADLSVYSTTKFIDGHSAALGGAVVTRDTGLLDRLRFIRKCTGAIQTPFNAWLTLQGLKTLPIRIRKQSESAEAVAEWLARNPAVSRVCYPTHTSHHETEVALRQHKGHHGAVVAFELAGGLERARRLIRLTRLFRFVEHVGSVESLITHPASMTHADVPADQRRAVGVADGLIRLSIGLEDVDDLIGDLDRAIRDCASGTDSRKTSSGTDDLQCVSREVRLCPANA